MPVHARLVCIPARDTTFAREAERTSARIPAGVSAADSLAWFETELRQRYPTVTVREQSELARDEFEAQDTPIWYVTRRDRFFRIDTTVLVPLPPEAAFAAYVERVTDWQVAVRLRPRELILGWVGSTYDATYDFLGRRFSGTFRVLAAERPDHVTLEAAGSGIRVWYTAQFVARDGKTRVHIVGDYELPDSVLGHVADRLGLERAITRDIERANAAYRTLCEGLAHRAPSLPGTAT